MARVGTRSSALTTRDRLLDAAEELFAAQGFAETSLRQITERASANLAAVNYHFGSKEALYRAVFLRHIRLMNARRHQELDALEAAGGAPALETVLDLLLRPIVELATSRWPKRHPFVQMMSRNLVQPPPFMAEVVRSELAPLLQRVTPIVQSAVPHLDPAILHFRLRFVVGASNLTYAAMAFLPPMPDEPWPELDPRAQLQHLLIINEAVLRAPAPPAEPAQPLAPA